MKVIWFIIVFVCGALTVAAYLPFTRETATMMALRRICLQSLAVSGYPPGHGGSHSHPEVLNLNFVSSSKSGTLLEPQSIYPSLTHLFRY